MRHLSTLARIILLSFVVFLSGVLIIKSSFSEAPAPGEAESLTAGYSYIHFLDYRLNPEQPPLGKVITATPLFFEQLNFPVNSLNWQRDINGTAAVSEQFLDQSGNDWVGILNPSRIISAVLSLLLILAIYWAAKDLIGKWWAILPAFLFAFFPTALASGHYANSSTYSALAIFLSVIAFLQFLNKPAKKKLFIAGIAFGVAQLTTFAALLLIPFFFFILLVFYLAGVTRDWGMTEPAGRWGRFSVRAGRYFRALFMIFALGFIVVFGVYLLFTMKYPLEKQFSDTTFLLEQFQPRWLGDTAIWLSNIPVLRAAGHYLLGIALNWPQETDTPWYSLLADVLLKTPLAFLALLLISLCFSIWNTSKAAWSMLRRHTKNFLDYLNTNFTEFAMLVFVGSYWAGGLMLGAMGLEKMLPTLPFVCVLLSSGVKKWAAGTELNRAKNLVLKIFIVYEEFIQISLKTAVLAILLVGYFVTALIAYPNFSSFTNLIAGKPSELSNRSDSRQ